MGRFQSCRPVVERLEAAAVGCLPSLELAELGLDRPSHLLLADSQTVDEAAVEDEHTAVRDRPHRELLVLRHPQLADDEDVERHTELAGELVADGDAASGEGEHDHVVTAGILAQPLGEESARFRSIVEPPGLHPGHARSIAAPPAANGRSALPIPNSREEHLDGASLVLGEMAGMRIGVNWSRLVLFRAARLDSRAQRVRVRRNSR